MPKTEKFVKLCNWLQNATAWTKINVWWRPVVQQKNAKMWENFETLQLAVEWHSMKQKSNIYQDQTSSSWEKCKNVRKFWNFTIGSRVPQHKQKSKLDQDQISSSHEKCQKLRNLWNFATACRMPQHEQKSKFDEDQ